MAEFDIKAAKARLAALEAEALSSVTGADAVPYFFHQQERFPYWTNRTGDIVVESDGEEVDIYVVTIVGRLYVAPITAGIVKGELEQTLDEWIALAIPYMNARELIQSAAYPAALDGVVRCRVTACRGYTEFASEGMIGTEMTFSVEFEQQIEQYYT